MTCTSYGTQVSSTSSTSPASLEELILVLVDEDASLFVSGTVSLQVDVELGGAEGVVLDAVCSFALKNNARELTAETFYL